MVKWYYTVIVGTQPGVYADWSQAAPTVIEISGAIHKKYKTYREAWEAFDRAGREGRVRAIQVDPQPNDFGAPAPISAAPSLSVVPDYHRQRDLHQNLQYPQNAPPACAAGCSARQPATRPVRRSSQPNRSADSATNDVTWQIRRESGSASRNTSSPISAHNVDLVTSIGAGPLRRTTSEYHGNSRQPLRTMSGYIDSSGSPSSLSSPSRSAGRSRVYEHADLPSGDFSSWQGEHRQNNGQGTVAPPRLPNASSTATQHGETGTAGTSAEIGQRARENPSSALLRTGHLAHSVLGESQVDVISGTAARAHRHPLDPFPVSDARTTIRSDHGRNFPFSSHRSPIPSTLGDQLVNEGQDSRNSVYNFLSRLGRAQSQGDDNDRRRASFQSADTSLVPSDSMQRVQSSHAQLQTRTESRSSPGAPILSRPPSLRSLASSAETIRSTLSFDVDWTLLGTSEEPENVASSTLPPTSPFFASSSLAADIVYSPSTLNQDDDPNEGDREEDVLSREQRHAYSSHPGNRGSARGALSPVEHVHSQFDDPNTGNETPLPLLQPLSPLLITSTFTTPTHFRTQNIRLSLADTAASSPRGVRPASPSSHFSFELSPPTTASGLGLLTGFASPRRHPLPQSPAAQSPVARSIRSTDAQSPIRDTESSRDTPQQDHASSPHPGAATAEDAQSVRSEPIDCGSLSHYNIPLPPSPVSSASNPVTQLQVQPAHRHSPRMSLYPSLAGEDPELPSPSSGLDAVFGLPTPGLSPIQTPAVIRSPSMDPRSPVPSQMRIPGDIMGTIFFGRPTPPTNITRILP